MLLSVRAFCGQNPDYHHGNGSDGTRCVLQNLIFIVKALFIGFGDVFRRVIFAGERAQKYCYNLQNIIMLSVISSASSY